MGGISPGLGGKLEPRRCGNETVFYVGDGFIIYPGITLNSLCIPGWPPTVDILLQPPKSLGNVLKAHSEVGLCVKRQLGAELEVDPGLTRL